MLHLSLHIKNFNIKLKISDSRKIAKTLVVFSNTDNKYCKSYIKQAISTF